MNENAIIEFNSKECKERRHSDCPRKWEGLGFIALCDCICHRKKDNVGSDVSGSASIIH